MSKPDITIPPEALEAAALDVFRAGFERDPLEGDAFDASRLAFARKYARAAILAALRAWPGMHSGPSPADARRNSIIFPLPQEKQDG